MLYCDNFEKIKPDEICLSLIYHLKKNSLNKRFSRKNRNVSKCFFHTVIAVLKNNM